MVKAIVFDVYGTLFDVSVVAAACDRLFPGNGEIISRVWRQKQLEYTWLCSLMKRYEDFDQINRDALRFTLNQLGKTYTDKTIDTLTSSYLTLPLHSGAREMLLALTGVQKLILSNGTEQMLLALLKYARLSSQFDAVLSADVERVYKPHPEVYELAVSTTHLSKEEVLFVSSNGWDVAGSKAFGFTVAFINRTGKPVEQLGPPPDYILKKLTDLVTVVRPPS